MSFIDIHCHILPGIDDGPGDIKESEEMGKVAVEDGVSHIFATPHIMDGVFNNTGSNIIDSVDNLRRRLPDSINILHGADVRISLDLIERIESGEIPTLGNSGYLLVEFPEYVIPPNVDILFFNLRHRGVIPIITHPERHLRLMYDLKTINKLKDAGTMFQITAMSITGDFGREIQIASLTMIKKGLADFVASDAHD